MVLDGIKLSPNQPARREGVEVRTIWGELAWQLGGAEGFARVADADASGTSPGKAVLEELLRAYAPCVILVDELVAYVRQFEDGVRLTGGSFDANLSFIQALTEALKAVPTAAMLASLPESHKEAGSQRGVRAMDSLAHYFGRVQALWKPVATEEAFEIVRRRLFSEITDRGGAEMTCRAFADLYRREAQALPRETQEAHYLDRLVQAYPIHPEVFDRLYEDWSTLDNFQRTRGVLKLMAKVIHRLWQDGNNDLLIMPGSLPLYDADVRNEAIYYLPQGWDPVLERDVDGPRAQTTQIEDQDTRLGSVQACRRTARAIFLGSAPSTGTQLVRGVEQERVLLGVAQPGQQLGLYRDALKRLGDRLHYLNQGNERLWFDTRPNLRREMEERKRRYQDREDLLPTLRDRITRALSLSGSVFGGCHVFTASGDVPDDWALRLVVLPPEASYRSSGPSQARERALELVKQRGAQPRHRQNRLIFLAAEADTVSRLNDQVRSTLAWYSIVKDIEDAKLNLDQLQAQQAKKQKDDAESALRRMVRETYKWLLAPVQQASPGKGLSEVQWEAFQLNPGASQWMPELERVLLENELVITQWAPVHLSRLLQTWFWRERPSASALTVWQQSCSQLYLPRFKNDEVLRHAVSAGSEEDDFFGVAQGEEGERYLGFSLGRRVVLPLDATVLIEPSAAMAYASAQRAREAAASGSVTPIAAPIDAPSSERAAPHRASLAAERVTPPSASSKQAPKRRFYGRVSLKPTLAKKEFAELVDEVIMQFAARADVTLTLELEINAESAEGFDEVLQRVVKENCAVLKFEQAEFERGD